MSKEVGLCLVLFAAVILFAGCSTVTSTTTTATTTPEVTGSISGKAYLDGQTNHTGITISVEGTSLLTATASNRIVRYKLHGN